MTILAGRSSLDHKYFEVTWRRSHISSVKGSDNFETIAGRTFQEVLHSKPAKATSWQPDLRAFTGWKTITSTQETKQNPTSTSRQGATNDSGADDRERVVAGTQQEEGHDVEEIELQVPALIPDRTTLTRDGLSAQARGKRKR